MTIAVQATTARRVPMDSMRKTAFIAGALYLITFITSIPVLALDHGVLHNPDFILGAGSDTGVLLGAVLEIVLALSGIGTAVVLYPVVRRQSSTAALGYVTARVVEGAMIFVGILSLLSIVTLRQDLAGVPGTNAASLVITGQSLVAVHNWTFLLGPGLMPVVSAMCLGSVLYRTRLVPRIIPTIGLIGAPMLAASGIATIFGLWDQVSAPAFVAALPIAVWEFSVGMWMLVKGFNACPFADGLTLTDEADRPAFAA